MPRNVYKGKRLTVTMPNEVLAYIEKLAERETRTSSQTALVLIQEAIAAREKNEADIEAQGKTKGDR